MALMTIPIKMVNVGIIVLQIAKREAFARKFTNIILNVIVIVDFIFNIWKLLSYSLQFI